MAEAEEKGNKETTPKTGKVENKIFREKALFSVMVAVFATDQISKAIIVQNFEIPNDPREKIVVINGFLDLIHRTNDGAAFSIMKGKNSLLAVISFFAMGGLIWFRHHFDNGTRKGKIALGLLMGGVLGNLVDRVFRESVVDFVRVYIERGAGGISEWPAFNVADAAICVGVGILFCLAWGEGAEDKEENP